MKKALIITYYWPPSGGGGVQRWLRFVKYFKQFGIEPIVFTPENPESPALDESLLLEVPEGTTIVKKNGWEPYTFYKKFTGKKKDDRINTGFLAEKGSNKNAEDISVWIRGNLFIPDARKFLIKPSIKFLVSYLKEKPVDIIVSTGPPHSMHMIALGLKKKLNIPWLADFRDPWTNIDFYSKLKLTKWADRKHRRQERSVIDNADKLVTVSWSWAEDFKRLGAKNIDVITNGFDPDDYKSLTSSPSKYFEICHIGSMNKDRNPLSLWEALAEVAEKIDGFKEDLKIILLGSTDHDVFSSLSNKQLIEKVEHIGYMPHKEVLQKAYNTSILILPLNDTPNVAGIIPGKIFEYIALNKPIICIGPKNGDSARIIRETKSGETVNFEDKDLMVDIIINHYNEFKKDKSIGLKTSNYNAYSRVELTKRMASLLISTTLSTKD